MPNYTVPNQRMVRVHRERATSDFLGIKNENWKAAFRDLGPYTFALYLYFAANADNYNLAFSPAAVCSEIGMPASTARDQFKNLIAKGYIVPRNGNGYDFFEVSQARAALIQKNSVANRSQNEAARNSQDLSPVSDVECGNIEINNRETSTNNSINNDLLEGEENPKAKEIHIPIPRAEGRKRPQKISLPPQIIPNTKKEFTF